MRHLLTYALAVVLVCLANHAESQPPVAPKAAPTSAPPPPASRIEAAEKSRAEELQVRDLAAQEEMAKWARWQFAATAGGLIVSAFGLVAILVSLALTRRATTAAQTSADAAQAATKIAQENHVAETRAWLSVDVQAGSPREGEGSSGMIFFPFTVRSTNHGGSPATSVGFYATISLADEAVSTKAQQEKFWREARGRAEAAGRTAIFPGATEVVSHSLVLRKSDVDAVVERNGGILPIVYGCVCYRSPGVEEVRQTRFAYVITNPGENGAEQSLDPRQPNWLQKQIWTSQMHFSAD